MKLLYVIPLLVSLINCSQAICQTTKEKCFNNGLTWYEVTRNYGGNTYYGIEDESGNTLLSTKWDYIGHEVLTNPYNKNEKIAYFKAEKNNVYALYTMYSECVIDGSRGYKYINAQNGGASKGHYFYVSKGRGRTSSISWGICNAIGDEVFSFYGYKLADASCHYLPSTRIMYMLIQSNNNEYGIIDASGKILIDPMKSSAIELKSVGVNNHIAEFTFIVWAEPETMEWGRKAEYKAFKIIL